jgi:hypothetical protein
MGHHRIYDERTGVPGHDNRARLLNRKISRLILGSLRVHTRRGRRRKKYLTTQARMEFGNLIVHTAHHLSKREAKP